MSVLCGAMGDMSLNREHPYNHAVGLAMGRVIGRTGLRPPTILAVAEEANTGSATLHRWFGGKQKVMPHAAAGFAGVFWSVTTRRINGLGWTGFLPSTEDDVIWVRAWLGFEELARSDDAVAEHVAEVWHDLESWFRRRVGRDLSDMESARLAVTLRGLWMSLTSSPPLDATLAQQLWAESFADLADDAGSGGAAA
ncbi:MAG: hypothetical protein ACRDPS_18955 [Nocardioides sp.]|uniref:hypothetical protein n=1 Tax=Nocardioides sp. TaxID=35761 RepID=UPI003D6C3BED